MHSQATVLLLVALSMIPLNSRARAEDRFFPGTHWEQVTPQSQDVDSAKLRQAVAWLEQKVPHDGVKRLVIVRNGRMIWKGPEADRRQRVWSVTKAFTSTAHGLLIEDGKCTLDTLAQDYNPKLAEYYPTVTLRHLATMTSGIDGVGGSYDCDAQGRCDRNALVDPAPPFFPPGTKYQYWDEATQQYGYVLTRIAGEPLRDLLQRRILGPIGIEAVGWIPDETKKVPNWTGGLEISASDLARFGHLFLRRGNWNGKQLISAEWVDAATGVQVPALGSRCVAKQHPAGLWRLRLPLVAQRNPTGWDTALALCPARGTVWTGVDITTTISSYCRHGTW